MICPYPDLHLPTVRVPEFTSSDFQRLWETLMGAMLNKLHVKVPRSREVSVGFVVVWSSFLSWIARCCNPSRGSYPCNCGKLEGKSFAMDRHVRTTSMWPHASTITSITSSIADQIESNTCPICFELMKSPDFSPILLSPCGHTFCAKCVTRHLSIHEKKSRYGGPVGPAPCPYCRQKISSQTLNISLQKMITNILSLQQTLEKADADKVGFSNGFLQAQTRCHILQNELQDSTRTKEPPLKTGFSLQPPGALSKTSCFYSPVHFQCQHLHEDLLETSVSKQRMEKEIAETDNALVQLRAKEEAIEENIRKVSLEHQKVLTDLMDTQNKSSSLKRSRDDVVAKLSLIQASLFALEQERDKYRLLSQDDHLLSEQVR